MRATQVIFPAKGQVALNEAERPDPQAGQVQVKAVHTAISPGTELAFLHHLPNTTGIYPTTSGYSCCGRVVKLGPDTPGPAEGELVVCSAHHATLSTVRAQACTPVGTEIPTHELAAFRLASIALQGVRKARVQLGESVAILGLGPIGNLAGQLARANGATCVVGIDTVAWRRDLALSSGFDAVTDSIERIPERKGAAHADREGFDVVIEATGAPQPINLAFQAARRMGRVVLLGSTRGDATTNYYRDVHKKGLTVLGAHDGIRGPEDDLGEFWSGRSDERTVVALLESRRIRLAPIVSDVMPAREAARAYERLHARNEQLMTIALDWSAL